jgi:hypothetical protein
VVGSPERSRDIEEDEDDMMGRRWPLAFALLFTIGSGVPGCSGSGDELPRESVSGTVTLDGEPLAEGMIQFSPSSGAPVGGGSRIQDGRFSIPRETGLIPGTYQVTINAAAPTGAEPTKVAAPKKAPRLAKELIPPKYNSQSKLTAEIKKGGTHDLKYELQSK